MIERRDLRTPWNALMEDTCRHDGPAVTCCETCFLEAVAALCAAAPGATSEPPDDESCCAVCAWPLNVRPEDGCVRGRCSRRPLPKRFYAPTRVCLEYQQMIVDTGTEHRFYPPSGP